MSGAAVDRAIEDLARRQHGAFSRAQAIAAGVTPRMITTRRVSGAWLNLDRGVYALRAAPFSWLRQVKAAELSVHGSAVSHRAAARLHGLPGYAAGAIDLVVERRPPASALASVHQCAGLRAVARSGMSVTALPLTLVHLAAIETRPRLSRTIDEVLVGGLASFDDLVREAEHRSTGHPRGVGALLELLRVCGDGYVPPTSELERLLWRVLDDPRLPGADRQAPFPWSPGGPQRVDAVIPEWRRIVEADGRRWHTRRADFERDRARDHLAQRHGYEVTRFGWCELAETPASAVELLLAIGRRTQRPFREGTTAA
jgi:very-short-patch-repair endonuclease